MQTRLHEMLLGGAILASVTATGLGGGAMAGMAEPHNIVEAARATVEDLDGGPFRTEFRANIRRADAVIVLPPYSAPREPGRPAVVVVHDGARGAWSDPGFFRATRARTKGAIPAGGVILMAMNVDAVRRLKDGSATIGGADGLRVASITTDIGARAQVTAIADVLAFVDVQGGQGVINAPTPSEGWRLAWDEDLNRRFYSDDATPDRVLSRGTTRTPGMERLVGGLRIAKGRDEPLP